MRRWTLAGRRSLILSVVLHALLLIVVYVFQSMIFPYLRLYGMIPLLLPIVSTGVAVYEGHNAGGVTGIFAGILCDISFNEPAGLFTVILTLMGLLIGILADTVIARGFVTFFFCCVAALAVCAFAQMFPLLFYENVSQAPLLMTALWQTVYSLVFTVPLWFFTRALGKRAQRASPSGRPL